MSFLRHPGFLLYGLILLLGACAQIVPPQGGAKDITPPRLLSVTPPDSQLNTRVNRIDLRFDEFITLSNPASEVTIAPILPFPLDISVLRRTVTVRIPDSLLKDNTTYRISFGRAIQDVHENNPFTGYNYIFSTGSWFDSLQLSGYVINAATGLRDSGALIVLYEASASDSAIVRQKPLYSVRTENGGNFSFKGLPGRQFRIYALRDNNNNLIYDGPGEMVAFADALVTPADTAVPVRLNLFAETDTSATLAETTDEKPRLGIRRPSERHAAEGFTYSAGIDTSDLRKRTQEITKPLQIMFSRPVVSININRVNLSYDSSGTVVEAAVRQVEDTSQPNLLQLTTSWKEDMVYTLRLLKGFARDSAGTEAMPGKYTFRTKREEDYAKLHIHLPSRYQGSGHVFVLLRGDDTVYQRTVRDTMIRFTRLEPGNYTMRVIIDRNENGQWDSGDLLGKRQPEDVIPYLNPISLRPGWENMIDFESTDSDRLKTGLSPGTWGAGGR